MNVNGQEFSEEGEYALSTVHFCGGPDATDQTKVAVTYTDIGMIAKETGPFERLVTAYHLRVDNLSFDLHGADAIRVDVRTGATFFPVVEGAVECPKEGCTMSGAWGNWDLGPYLLRRHMCN